MKPIYFKTGQQPKKVIWGYFFIILLSLFPVLLAMLAGGIGGSMGCNINEAGTDECIRAGIHFGTLLNGMVVIGWLAILTVPAGVIAFIMWTIIVIHDSIYYMNNYND